MSSRLTISPIYPILNLNKNRGFDEVLALATKLTELPITLVQLRSKDVDDQQTIECATALLQLFHYSNTKIKLIINDRSDICETVGADGVHLGQTDEDWNAVRKRLGKNAIIGVSTHSVEQITLAQEGPDYLGFGPIFLSPTKQGHADVVGLNGLRSACKASKLPIVAIGGISVENARETLHHGASAVAMISQLESPADPEEVFKKILG